jgi:hypothetical protein
VSHTFIHCYIVQGTDLIEKCIQPDFGRKFPDVFLGLLGPKRIATTFLRNASIYLPTDSGVASQKTPLVKATMCAAVQKISLAFIVTAITNTTLQLGR